MHVIHEFSQNIKCFLVNSKLFLTHCSFKTLANIVVATLALPQVRSRSLQVARLHHELQVGGHDLFEICNDPN